MKLLFTGVSYHEGVHLGSKVLVSDSYGRMRALGDHEVHRAGEANIGLPGVKSLHDMPTLKHGEGRSIPTIHELKGGINMIHSPQRSVNYGTHNIRVVNVPQSSYGYNENQVQVINMPQASVSYGGNSDIKVIQVHQPAHHQQQVRVLPIMQQFIKGKILPMVPNG